MKAKINRVTIELVHGNLLKQPVAAVVHATDPGLSVPQWLETAAGPDVREACREIGFCEVGAAVITGAGKLGQSHIIHAVGPRWGEGSERGKLANVTWSLLKLAEDNGLRSIAMPAISVGAMGYPVENAAKTILGEIIDFTFEKLRHLRHIIICLDTEPVFETFTHEFRQQIQALKDAGEGKVRV